MDVVRAESGVADPLFFLLHCNLDRLWHSWQQHNPANKYAVGGREIQNFLLYNTCPTGTGPLVTKGTKLYLANMGPNSTIGDVLDIRKGGLCYDYEY
jgi:tyrosinase